MIKIRHKHAIRIWPSIIILGILILLFGIVFFASKIDKPFIITETETITKEVHVISDEGLFDFNYKDYKMTFQPNSWGGEGTITMSYDTDKQRAILSLIMADMVEKFPGDDYFPDVYLRGKEGNVCIHLDELKPLMDMKKNSDWIVDKIDKYEEIFECSN